MLQKRLVGLGLCCLLAVTFVALFSNALSAEELRDWKSADGSFSVSARLFARFPSQVLLEKKDGQRITVKATQLSDADKRFLETYPFAEYQRNRYQAEAEPATGQMDLSSGVEITVEENAGSNGWALPQIPRAPVNLRELEVSAVGKYNPNSYLYSQIHTDLDGTNLLWADGRGAGISGVFGLENSSKRGKLDRGPSRGWSAAGISDDGRFSVFYNVSGGSKSTQIGLFRAGDDQVLLYWPSIDDGRSERRTNPLRSAVFVNEFQLITTDAYGQVCCWDLHQRKLVWYMHLPDNVVPTFSHDHSYMIGCTKDKIFLLNLNDQQIVASKPFGGFGVREMSLSPDGRHLLVVNGVSVCLLDAQTATLLDSWTHLGANQIVGWTSSQQAVIGKVGGGTPSVRLTNINQPENSYRVSAGQLAIDGLGRLWSLRKEAKSPTVMLEGYTLPAIPMAAEGSTTGRVSLDQGDRVKLEVKTILFDASPDLYQRIKKQFSKDLVDTFKQPNGRRPSGVPPGFPPDFPSGFGSKPKSEPKRTAEKIEVPVYDASAEATEVIRRLVEDAGYIVDPNASKTLAIEFGPPDQITDMYKGVRDIDRGPDYHLQSMEFPDHFFSSWPLRMQMWLKDAEGKFVFRSILYQMDPVTVGEEDDSSLLRNNVRKLDHLAIPRRFIQSSVRATIRLKQGKISVNK